MDGSLPALGGNPQYVVMSQKKKLDIMQTKQDEMKKLNRDMPDAIREILDDEQHQAYDEILDDENNPGQAAERKAKEQNAGEEAEKAAEEVVKEIKIASKKKERDFLFF